MKINTHKNTRRNIIITSLVAAVLLVAGYTAYAKTQNYWPFSTANETPQSKSDDQTTADDSSSKSADSDSTLPSKIKSDDNAPANTPPSSQDSEDTPQAAIETPRIERASQSGAQVKIVASFQKSSTGKCEVTLRRGSTRVQRTSSIVLGPSYYTCTFSIPVSSFSESGTWTFTLSHLRNSSVSTTKVSELVVQK